MSPCHPFRPVPGQCGPHRRGPLPAPPFDPRDYWATRRLVSSLSEALEKKLDKADVVGPGEATEAGKAADAKSTYEELNGIHAKLANKADKATTLAGYGITDAATKAELADKADLVGGKVPAAQLPSYVDEVLEYGSKSEFPSSGESGRIYVAKDTNLVYRWSGTQYVEISPSPVLDDTVTETSSNGVKSSGIWSWVKSLLPKWLTSDYAEPATVKSVATKADKATTLAGYGITDAVPFVEDVNGNKTAVTIGLAEIVGQNSLANGERVTASGNYSHAEGLGSTASGRSSHAEGANTVASGDYSHAEGGGTTASGLGSHAEGESTTASGLCSHAAGFKSRTRDGDDYAFAWNGDGARGDKYTSHGPGTFNINPVGGLDGFWIGERTLLSIMSDKADKVAPSAAGNLAALTADGDIEDSGKKPRDFRETTDNICHKSQLGNVWTCDPPLPEGYEIARDSDGIGWQPKLNGISLGEGKQDPGNTATTLSWDAIEWQGGYAFTATRTTVAKSGEPFVTEGAISTNNPAFVSAVQNTPTSGMPDDTPTDWGTFGTVGAALAALAAGLKWCKNILGSLASGYSTFAAWIASKLDRASLLAEYSATSAYSVGAIVCHDGSIYQCKTAIADGGEAWNAEHWELRKLDDFFTESNSLLTGTIDAEVISKGTAPDAHLEAPTDERLKLVLADNSVAYDSAKALPYKLTSVIGDRVIATMTLTAASTDITLPTISANDTTVKDFILDVTNAYAVEGVATDAGINIPRTDFKLVTRDGESLTAVTTVKAGKSAFICFTQKSPVVVDGTTYPCWCVIQLPFGDPS